MTEYAHPEVLVSTEWVAQHLSDSKVRLVEVDVNTFAYEQGHIAGAVGWNWQTQLQDQVRRDILSKTDFEALMSASGITNNTTVILYGDNNNWFAAYAFWQMKLYGHQDVRLMNGGRKKWLDEKRPLTTEAQPSAYSPPFSAQPKYVATRYQAKAPDFSIRSKRLGVMESANNPNRVLVDVRSADEFTGKIIAPQGMAETAQRAGHIPGAVNIPWGEAVREDGTFKTADELRRIYAAKGITPDKEITTYCRIGERSSHSWLALKFLLGFDVVQNYDGSWTEWGNLVDAPVARGES